MCDCYEMTKAKIIEHYQAALPEGATGLEVEVGGYLFGLAGGDVTHRSSNPITIQYQAPKKAGGMKKVSQKSFIRATYCPFCGVAYG
jgi:hypothetical protein